MAKSHEEVHADIYDRINGLETKIDETNGYLRGVVESNVALIRLLRVALYVLASLAAACLFALIYGAIGDKGLHSVRQTLPAVPIQTQGALPAHNDFDKWQNRHQKA